MGIQLSVESTVVIPKEYLEKYHITVLPMHVIYGTESYDDSVNIGTEEIIRRYREKNEIPSTSACSIGEYTELFASLTADGSEVVHYSMSSEMSSTYENACAAAKEFEHVYVLDTRNITSGTGMMVLKAAQMRDDGFSAKEIVRRSREMIPKIRSSFVLDNLEFLRRGGRCSSVVAFGANVLGIKPSIVVEDGKMGVGKKFRGKFDACIQKYVESVFADAKDVDLTRASIEYSYGITDAQVEMVKKEIKKYAKFDEILVCKTCSTITAHCGSNTIGVLYLEK